MDRIVSEREALAKTEYICRHNKAPAYLHWSICKDHDIEIIQKWYEHKPETLMNNKDNNITIMWDMPVHNDRTISKNRPEIIVNDSVNSTSKLIDMTIPSNRNIALKGNRKEKQVQRPRLEIQGMWQMKTEVTPEVVGALGTVEKGMVL